MGFSPGTETNFLVAQEDELGIKDYEAMLEHEMAGKKRKSVIAGLQAHLGGE